MAGYMLLRLVMVGVVIGMFALAMMAGKMVNAAWYHLSQRRESRV